MAESTRRRRRIKLKVKITFMMLTMLFSVFVVTNGYIINKIFKELIEREKLIGITYAEFLAHNSEEALVGGDDLSLAKFINQVKDKPGVKYAIIMGQDGKILAHSQFSDFFGSTFHEFNALARVAALNDIRRFRLTAKEPSYRVAPADAGAELLDIARPIVVTYAKQPAKRIGMVRVGISLQRILSTVTNTMIKFFLVSSIGILLGVLGSVALAGYIVKPIRLLVDGVKAIGDGNFEQRITIIPNDEIGDLTASFNRMAQSLQEKEFIKKTLSTYVTQQVADLILSDPAKAGIQGERRVISILFVDIRNFTSLAENTDAQKIVNLLNGYFSMMVDIVIKYEGTIDKFLGDALMALFGAPLSFKDHAEKAVLAALEIKKAMYAFNESLTAEHLGPIRIGIGVSSGEAIVGNIGSAGKKMEYTAIGDTVNIAQRLQSVSRHSNIIISQKTHDLVKHKFEIKPQEPVLVKGKDKPIVIYEVMDLLA
jgi:class 3 adenylate cyclase